MHVCITARSRAPSNASPTGRRSPEEERAREARRFTPERDDDRRPTTDDDRRRRMKIPTYDAKPGSKAYSGLGERLMSAMGWSRCVESDDE